jgi:hypothetical protein
MSTFIAAHCSEMRWHSCAMAFTSHSFPTSCLQNCKGVPVTMSINNYNKLTQSKMKAIAFEFYDLVLDLEKKGSEWPDILTEVQCQLIKTGRSDCAVYQFDPVSFLRNFEEIRINRRLIQQCVADKRGRSRSSRLCMIVNPE